MWLAEEWKLPDIVLDTNLFHHAPSLAKRNEKHVAMIHIADYLTAKNIMSPTEKDPNYPLDPASLEILGYLKAILRTWKNHWAAFLSQMKYLNNFSIKEI